MSKKINVQDATSRCRCQDPEGKVWIYLNVHCMYRDTHLPWEDYGFTNNSIMTSAREYHRAWLAGEYNDSLPPEMRPGYRPHQNTPEL